MASHNQITECNIITIRGLPNNLDNTQMLSSQKWFGQFGKIQSICVVQQNDRITAYLKYIDAICAANAIQRMNGHTIKDTQHTLNVQYNVNQSCTPFLSNEDVFREKRAHIPLQKPFQIISDIERAMFEEEITELQPHIQQTEQCKKEKEDVDTDKLKKLQTAIDVMRVKHCELIRNFNVLEQKYNNTNDHEVECMSLRRKCLWLEHQLESMMCSNNQLQNLVFGDVSTSEKSLSNEKHHHEVEGYVGDR